MVFEQQPTGNDPASSSLNSEVVIPVVEEQLHVSTEQVETGYVRISKTVHQEETTVDVPMHYEQYDVERIAVNRYVETPPEVRYEGETMIVPVLREVAVVEKRLMLVEELHIIKRQLVSNVSQQVTLRKEEVTVTRVANGETQGATD